MEGAAVEGAIAGGCDAGCAAGAAAAAPKAAPLLAHPPRPRSPEPLVHAPASTSVRDAFAADGFAVVGELLPPALCEALAGRLEAMLSGVFDTGMPPDKVPSGKPPGRQPRVEQFVNAWKGDRLFGSVVHGSALSEWVADLAGWAGGAEVLQDQVWCKPPRSGPIAFHRDAAYMGECVVTVWITLDDLEPSLGPLEYARGSHAWPPPPYEGYTPALFGRKDWRCELHKAAGHCKAAVDLVQVLVPRGGGSVHGGGTWHGSGVNTSGRPRRGLGIHFGPAGARPAPPTALARQIALPRAAAAG